MNNRVERWVSAIAILGVLASCTVRQEIDVDTPVAVTQTSRTIHFTTGGIDTKATFGNAVESDGVVRYPAYWTENDKALMISLNYEYAVTAGINADKLDEEGNILHASFDASFDGIDASSPYRFYLVSPADALLWASADREAVSIDIKANQVPQAGSVDESAMVIVASSEEFTVLPDDVEVNFKHITSYGKMTLTNLAIPDGAELTAVTLLCEDQPLTGSWYYRFSDGGIEEKEGSSSIVLDTKGIDVAGGDPVWFACAPVGTALAGKKLTIKANLSNGTSLVRTITLHSTVDYKSGRVTTFSVNMASATTENNQVDIASTEDVYQLVTSTGSLSAGDEIILVNSTSPQYAMTSSASSSGLAATSSGFSVGDDGYIRLSDNSTVVRLFVKSIQSGSVVLWDGSSNYLGYSSGSSGSGPGQSQSRYLAFSTTSRTWSLSFSNGAATLFLSSGNGNTKYYVRYNSNYFNLATSSNTVALYKKTTAETSTSVDLTDDPVSVYSDYGAYLSERNLVYNSTTDQLSREYDAEGTLTFSILAPEEDQVVEFAGIPASGITLGSSFRLQLTWISGITTEIDKAYTVYVVKEEGHMLWLSDGAGNGFIVKR